MPIAIQNRILLGITFFVGVMLLVAWLTINEPPRMSVFTDQYNGRAIENGAILFFNACATCHNQDAKGQKDRAPALLNPMLFLDKNPAVEAKAKIDDLQKQLDAANGQVKTLADNQTKLADLQKQLAAETDKTKQAELQTQIDSLTTAIGRANADLPTTQKTIADLQKQFDQANADLAALVAQGWDPARPPRLKEIAWGGTLKGYITDAVAAGRPLSYLYWPNNNVMPTWGQAYGGPLRPDEVDDVAEYILNFRDQALKLTPKDVNQQFSLPGAGGGPPPLPPVDPNKVIFKVYGKDPDSKVDKLPDLKGGDAANGEKLYTAYACATCHLAGTVGPTTKGTYFRVQTQRLADPQLAAQHLDAEHYLAQSILYPNAYLVPSYDAGKMPQTFGNQMSIDQLKDIIAFLETQDTP